MEVKLLKKEDNKMHFLIKGVNYAFVNSLRRLIVYRVPVMSIDEITVKTNSSALYDEILAHRLGLIPLKTDLKSYNVHTECKCEGKGCENCQLVMTLKAKGPCTVYSESIKSKDPKVVPVYGKMIIVKLLEGQEIDLQMIAVLGQGIEHIKFAPAIAYYQGYPIKVLNEKEEVVNFKGNDEDALKTANMLVEGSTEDFIFTVESYGQLTPEQIVNKAIEIYEKKVKDFDKALSKIKE